MLSEYQNGKTWTTKDVVHNNDKNYGDIIFNRKW